MVRPTSQKTVVSRLFSTSVRPIYVLDATGRIVFCNEALSTWVGIEADDLLNLRCIYGNSTGQYQHVLDQLAPPPSKCGTQEACQWVVTLAPHGSTATQCRQATAMTLDSNQRTATTLVVIDAEMIEPAADDPFDAESLHRQLGQLRLQQGQAFALENLIGVSPAMKRVRRQIELATKTNCSVSIVGQTGSGKETIARTIHQQRRNRNASIVPLSCNVLEVDLLAATVEAMSQMQSTADQEQEQGSSTLLLLSVDELNAECQAALQAILEAPNCSFQTIATSNRTLTEHDPNQPFREELAQHLVELEIVIPNLVNRLEDIPPLAQAFVEKQNGREHAIEGFTREAMEALVRYGWPREVTELREVVSFAYEAAQGRVIDTVDLPAKLLLAAEAATIATAVREQISLDAFLAEIETEIIVRALKQAKGNKAQAARALDISRAKLLRRIDQLGIAESSPT